MFAVVMQQIYKLLRAFYLFSFQRYGIAKNKTAPSASAISIAAMNISLSCFMLFKRAEVKQLTSALRVTVQPLLLNKHVVFWKTL